MSESRWLAFEYEVSMFYATRVRLSDSAIEDLVVRNALVESSLLHTRILVECLLDRGTKPDDVSLHQLMAGVDATAFGAACGPLADAYGDSKTKETPCWTLNKRLAHLTIVRTDSFDYASVYTTLDPLIAAALLAIAATVNRPRLSALINQHGDSDYFSLRSE